MTEAAWWAKTACILCECNCGIEVRLGPLAVGRHSASFEPIRGDKDHPASKGYTCEKALRLDHYQNGGRRFTSPLRKRADGTFEEMDWDTPIREVAAKFACVYPPATREGFRLFFRRVSDARSPPTPSSVTTRGERRTPTEPFGSPPVMPSVLA